ncbi:MAG TPA: signal recognition particle-docking protein FtsY, partial [Acidilobales archaeon]|nr:signal recognition particle-docking protein FtsY [Acidilobales archaeon]
EKIIEELKLRYERNPFKSRDEVLDVLKAIILSILEKSKSRDFVEELCVLRLRKKPVTVVFLGINGVGKTTTIAKIAKKLRDHGLKVVLSAADTYRAGAQEQIEYHAKKLGLPVIKHRYGSDPAAVAFDTVRYAEKHGYDVVLIDTAGRMHTDIDLVNELKKIIRVVEPDFKTLVVDALTGNDAIDQARMFNEHIGVDNIVIAKMDADVKGGVALSLAYELQKPIIYVGTGQRYEDLEPFAPKKIVSLILG